MGFTQIFKDDNDYNEKTIIGFISFAVMVLTALIDLYTSLVGIELNIKEYIYQSFVTVTIGSFGVAGLERFSGSAKIEAEATAQREMSDKSTSSTAECPHCGLPPEG